MSTENLKVVITGDASELDKASAGADAALAAVSQRAATAQKRMLGLSTAAGRVRPAFRDLGTTAVSAAQKVERTTVQMEQASQSMRNMSKSSSSATNSLFALSGIVQDAPYGFRAIANNITFFTQELAYSAKASGGFGAALKAMGSAFLGPAGIIFAISAGVSLLDTFLGSSHKAASGVDELAQKIKDLRSGLKDVTDIRGDTIASAAKQTVELKALYDAATDVTRSQKERLKAAKDLQLLQPKTFGSISQLKIISGQAADAFNQLSTSILKVAQANVVLQNMEKNLDKIGDATKGVSKLQDDYNAKLAALKAAQDKLKNALNDPKSYNSQGLVFLAKQVDDARDAFNAISSQVSRYNKVIQDANTDNTNLQKSFNALDFKQPKPKPGPSAGTGGNLKTIASLLAEIQTKFAAIDVLAKGLGQSQEQIGTEKIKVLYDYVQKIADVGGPGAVKAIQGIVEQANKIQAGAFLPTLTGGRAGVTAPAGISGNPGVPTSINPNLGYDPLNTHNAKTDAQAAQAWNKEMQPLVQTGRLLDTTFQGVFSTLANGGNAFQAMLQAIEQLIVKLTAAAAAAALLSVFSGGSLTFAGALGELGGSGGMLKNLLHLGTGGYVPGPQLAVIGDAPGGEWVLNQRQISAILNGGGMGGKVQVTGEFRIQGNDLVAAVNNTNDRNMRVNG